MTVNIAYSTVDSYLYLQDASWATVVAGVGGVFGGGLNQANNSWGQGLWPGYYYIAKEVFLSFTYSLVSGEDVISASIRLSAVSALNTAVSRTLDIAEYDWSGTYDFNDWRNSSQLAAATVLGAVENAQNAGTRYMEAGSDALTSRVAADSSPFKVVIYSNRYAGAIAPTVDETSQIAGTATSGTTYDPCLRWLSVPRSTHQGVSGAHVQLSDRSWAYLQSDGAATPTITLCRCTTGGSATTLATVPTGTSSTDFAVPGSMQALSLVVDASDNLYVIGAQGSNRAALAARAYVKGAGTTWTAQTLLASALPSYLGAGINQTAAAWHNTGTSGTILAVAMRGVGWAAATPDQDAQYALLNCASLLAGSGTLFRASGSALGVLVPTGADTSHDYTYPCNQSGTSLDVIAAPDDPLRGYVQTVTRVGQPGDDEPTGVYRYVLASGGASIPYYVQMNSAWGVKDPMAKVRVLTPGQGIVLAISADSDTLWGLSLAASQNIGTGGGYTELAYVVMSNQGITSMPDEADLAVSSAWDTHYDPIDNKLWFYYVDVADDRRILRTGIDLNTWLPTKEETEVAADVGSAGSTVTSLRVARGYATGDVVLVHLALDTSGTPSSQLVVDSLNKAPTMPTLTPKVNFDADDDADFEWTFNDPNSSDTQSAYQLQIVDVSDGSVDVDTGKVTSGTESYTLSGSTIANEGSYQWRVRTYDSDDQVSPWSTYGTFQTSASGTVTVTDPASDNPAGVITNDYAVAWSVAGTTQADYRVVVTRTDTSAELLDTDWVTSTDTTYTVEGMLSDVEYQVAVTVRNGAEVESGTGTRLITPSYSSPDTPTFALVGYGGTLQPSPYLGGYIEVDVTNPAPSGDRPDPTSNTVYRRPSGATAWTAIASVNPDATYLDYAAGSGITYEYLVRAIADDGSYTDSETDTTSITLRGVWLHDPLDPAGTVVRLPYGKASRSAKIDPTVGGTLYAGRTYPVVDWGETQQDQYQITAVIPFGTDEYGGDWAVDVAAVRTFATLRRTVCMRDSRGRRAFGVLTGFGERDTEAGTEVSFTVSAVDYDEDVT